MDPGCFWHMHAEGPGSDRELVLEALQQRLAYFDVFPLPELQTWIYDVNQIKFCIDRVGPR